MIITRDYKIMTTILYFVHSFCSPSGDPQISPVVAVEIQICPSGQQQGQLSANLNMHNLGVMSPHWSESLALPRLHSAHHRNLVINYPQLLRIKGIFQFIGIV